MRVAVSFLEGFAGFVGALFLAVFCPRNLLCLPSESNKVLGLRL